MSLTDDIIRQSITPEMIDAAAKVMWDDRDARMGGPWESRSSEEVCVVQTRATARAALLAALAPGIEDPSSEIAKLRAALEHIARYPWDNPESEDATIVGVLARSALLPP